MNEKSQEYMKERWRKDKEKGYAHNIFPSSRAIFSFFSFLLHSFHSFIAAVRVKRRKSKENKIGKKPGR